MQRQICKGSIRAFLVVSVGALALACGGKPPPPPGPGGSSACAFPTAMAATPEQTAWQLFVAANCAAGSQLTWETWTEQCVLQPNFPGCAPANAKAAATSSRHRLHGSRLRSMLSRNAALDASPGPCNPMLTKSTADPSLVQFVPTNLSANPQFCEEVFVNPAEVAYVQAPVRGQSLLTLTGQVQYAKSSTQTPPIDNPTSAVEIKADWLPAASLNPPFDCSNPPQGVYVETIDGACYALVAIHLSSKLLPNWLWATFEPQNSITNPNRCNPKLYSNCNDPWGSIPATSTGQSTQQSPDLTALMKSAGLPAALFNYRLVAAQTTFDQPTNLGNSFVEFNADVPAQQASCISCHAEAWVTPGTPPSSGTPNSVTGPIHPPPGVYTQDFSWMLGFMPPQ